MPEDDLRRVNIRVTPEVYEWFMNKSKKSGVSMSALMYLALEAHMQQQLALANPPLTVARGQEVGASNWSTNVPRIDGGTK